MRLRSGFSALLLLLLSIPGHVWAGEGPSAKDAHRHFMQYGCSTCHAQKGGLTEEGLKQLPQGLG